MSETLVRTVIIQPLPKPGKTIAESPLHNNSADGCEPKAVLLMTFERLRFHRVAIDAVLQREAVEKLHGDKGMSVLFANVVNRADVWMIQRGNTSRIFRNLCP